MQQRRLVAPVALATVLTLSSLAGCRKDRASASSPVAALLPAATAAQLPAGLVTFAEELPADVDAFGYVDAGRTLEQLSSSAGAFPEHRALYADLTEMVQRRWGVDLRRVSGVGFIVYQAKPLLAVAAASAPPKGGEATERIMLGELGKLTVLGEAEAVTAILAAGKQSKRLHQSDAAWLRGALSRAAGSPAFVTVDVKKALADEPAEVHAMLGDVLHATFTVGASGAAVVVTSEPGSIGKVRTTVEQGLELAQGAVAAQLATLPAEQPGPLVSVLLRHYSEALWKSIDQKVEGDELVIRLGWHAPTLPMRQPATSAERLVVPGEVGVMQLDLGAPLLDLLIAATDVLQAPLDRARLKKELAAELAVVLGVAGLDPRGVIVSASAQGFLVSLHNAPVAAAGTRLPLLGDAVPAVATPWGLALSPMPKQGLQLLASGTAVSRQEGGLPLGESPAFATQDAVLRGYLDVTQLPPVLREKLPEGLREVRHVAFSSSMSRSEIEASTAPGKTKGVADDLAELINLINPPMSEELYKNRAQGSATEELLAIMSNVQRLSVKRYLTPTSVTDDKLTFVAEIPKLQMQVMASAAAAGIVAAVAIPAFMDYQLRGRRMRDRPIPHDPDLLPPEPLRASGDAE